MAEASERCPPSGYDEEFVSEVEEDFQCLICHLPLKDPVQTRCGHRFCKKCLEEHFRRQEIRHVPLTCPADRDCLVRDRDIFPDKAIERKILSFGIKCSSEGCEWTGELREKEVHLSSCGYEVIPCPNTNCSVKLQRRNLSDHLLVSCDWRIVKCDHCGETCPKRHLQDHIDQCSQFPVICPNNCGFLISRGRVSIHLEKNCSFSIIPCPHAHTGCEMEVRRGEVDSHLQDFMKHHLDLVCVKLHQTEDKLETLQKRLEGKSPVMAKIESPLYPFKFVWKVSAFSDKMRQARAGRQRKLESDPFYTENYGYRLKLRVYPYGRKNARRSHLSAFIVVTKGEYDAILPWPFKRKMKFTLIDQQEDLEQQKNFSRLIAPYHIENYERPQKEENLGRGFRNFISHEELHSKGYVKNDMLFLQFEVGPDIRPVKKIISLNSSSEKDETTSSGTSSERDVTTSSDSSSESDTSD